MAAPKGNKNAAKGKMWDGAIRRALAEDRSALAEIAKKLIACAKDGDAWAIEHLAERLDGKAKHIIEATVEHTVDVAEQSDLRSKIERAVTQRTSPRVQ